MAGSHFFGLGTFLQTLWHAFFTSGSEGTAFGEIDGAGDISLQDDPLFLVAGIRNRNSGEKSLGVRMHRSLIKHFLGSSLHNEAEVHNGDPVGDHFHDGEVMRNENVGQIEFLLQMMEEVQHLGLDGNVQSGNGLVGDDELRFYGQGPGDSDTLFLTAGELVRITLCVFRA